MAERRVGLVSWLTFWSIALGGCGFDLATKHLVFSRMAVGEVKSVIDDVLELQPSRNTGALWGLGSSLPQSSLLFATLSIVAAMMIVWWLFVRGAARDLKLCVALGLVMAGAMGNCFDRLRFGYVRDFLHFHVDAIRLDFAIFNFADNMLVLGAIGLIVLALRPDEAMAMHALEAPSPEPAPTEPARQTS